MTITKETSIHDLIGRYWDIAYQEGKTGVSRGTEAQEVLSKINLAIAHAAKDAEPVHTDHPMRHYDRTCPACQAKDVESCKHQFVPDEEAVAHSCCQGCGVVRQDVEPVSEQSVFEEWLALVCPSGDAAEVQSKWVRSMAYQDYFGIPPTPADRGSTHTDYDDTAQNYDAWTRNPFTIALHENIAKQGYHDDTALLRQALEALKYHMAQTRPIYETTTAITALRERLGEVK